MKGTNGLEDGEDVDSQAQSIREAYRKGTSAAIRNVIDEIDRQAKKRVESGFNEISFTLGVSNCFLIIVFFCNYPEHFWLLYFIQGLYFFPVKFMELMRKVPNQVFYLLDFCWIMNFLGIISLVILMFSRGISRYVHKVLFHAAFGIACGPLLGSTMSLPFVSLIFHDVSSMTSVFIHIFPPLLFYCMRWNADDVKDSWPNTFLLDYEVNFFPKPGLSFEETVFGSTIIFYFLWFVPYTAWQLVVGLNLPKNEGKYDTVFHSNMRDGACGMMGKTLWNRSSADSLKQSKTNDFEFRDFVAYMTIHVIAFLTSLLILAYPCSLSRYAHGTLLSICAVICVWRGSKRYTYYSTKMYSQLIRKQFSDDLIPQEDEGGSKES